MKEKENMFSMDGQVANFSEDFERESLKDSVYLQADREEYERRIMQEIMEEEYRLPARITVIKPQPDELKDNALSFRGTD